MRDSLSVHLLISGLIFTAFLFALVDIITRDEAQVKHLPKVAWVLLVVFIPLIGTVLWFALGRVYEQRHRENVSFGDPRRWDRGEPRQDPLPHYRDTRSTEEQLADLEREIEADRRRNRGLESGSTTEA